VDGLASPVPQRPHEFGRASSRFRAARLPQGFLATRRRSRGYRAVRTWSEFRIEVWHGIPRLQIAMNKSRAAPDQGTCRSRVIAVNRTGVSATALSNVLPVIRVAPMTIWLASELHATGPALLSSSRSCQRSSATVERQWIQRFEMHNHLRVQPKSNLQLWRPCGSRQRI